MLYSCTHMATVGVKGRGATAVCPSVASTDLATPSDISRRSGFGYDS